MHALSYAYAAAECVEGDCKHSPNPSVVGLWGGN
jgi:hypothetical protein